MSFMNRIRRFNPKKLGRAMRMRIYGTADLNDLKPHYDSLCKKDQEWCDSKGDWNPYALAYLLTRGDFLKAATDKQGGKLKKAIYSNVEKVTKKFKKRFGE